MFDHNVAVNTSCCASCGIAEIDDIKLKECTAGDLVRYCSDECQIKHKSEHKETYKKRAAELHDELLFKQPESTHLGDCPICMLPMPLDLTKSIINYCCSKMICHGCEYANQVREEKEDLEHKCPFCRKATPETKKDCDKLRVNRIKANDPVAMSEEGVMQYNKCDYKSAFEYWTKAAELGDVDAHYRLSHMYHEGEGVQKDRGKEIHHLEKAGIGGHAQARDFLGVNEWDNNDNAERAVRHWIIAAAQGDDHSIELLKDVFEMGLVEKEDLDTALRAHQTAVDATKSPQREEAEEYHQDQNCRY